jgi:hypothetical protein
MNINCEKTELYIIGAWTVFFLGRGGLFSVRFAELTDLKTIYRVVIIWSSAVKDMSQYQF